MSKNTDFKYKKEYLAGAHAKPGMLCPFGEAEIGKRCAWLGGHHDAHGTTAWRKAKGLKSVYAFGELC